jgi:hypothetical protein
MIGKTKIGQIFCRGKPENRELTMNTANSSFGIPAGDPAYEVNSQIALEAIANWWG